MSRKKHSSAVLPPVAPKPVRSLVAVPLPVIDHPQAGENIAPSSHYAVRVGVPGPVKSVEVSIDQGPWQACRPAEGYWWYDWSGFEPGEHEVVARSSSEGRPVRRSEPRQFFVAGKPAAA